MASGASVSRRLGRGLATIARGLAWPVVAPIRWLRGAFDAEDVLFYCGCASVAYGFGRIYEPYGWIALGSLLIAHVYVPELYAMLSLFAPAPGRKAERK